MDESFSKKIDYEKKLMETTNGTSINQIQNS
jgi:hypothetical protein